MLILLKYTNGIVQLFRIHNRMPTFYINLILCPIMYGILSRIQVNVLWQRVLKNKTPCHEENVDPKCK